MADLRASIADGETIRTVATGVPNHVIRIAPEGVYIETEKSRNEGKGPQLVPAWMIDVAYDELQRAGSLSQQKLLHELDVKRSAAVTAILARLPGVEVVSASPTTLGLTTGARATTPAGADLAPKRPAPVVGRVPEPTSRRRIGLVGCAKTKRHMASPARDLYTSALFRGRRRYVEQTCSDWFILSAKHGVLGTDEIVEPYDVTLNNASIPDRRVWSRRVLEQLQRQLGELRGVEFEVHAGANYRDFGLVEGLRSSGAQVSVPAAWLSQGQQLAFYKQGPEARPRDLPNLASVVALLRDPNRAVPASMFLRDHDAASRPGLYSWWADDAAREQLGSTLSGDLPSLIYAGQAGATTSQQGIERAATLGSRIGGNHLRGNIGSSTFRKTLASLLLRPLQLRLGAPGRLDPASNDRLTEWMGDHLSIATVPWPDRSTLMDLEEAALHELDPPLNLMGMPATPIRVRLGNLRKAIS